MDSMIIEKTPVDYNNCRKPLLYFESARNAFREVLKTMGSSEDITLLLPGYIGYSAREGSGIYDPVIETDTTHIFYRIHKDISIDIDDFRLKIESVKNRCVVLLVHYFGYPDLNIDKIVEICRKHSAIIIEDAAHALFTDYIDNKCGFYGDYVLYSIHKMLPFEKGGILKCNADLGYRMHEECAGKIRGVFDYDFRCIAKERKDNAAKWELLLRNKSENVIPLHDFEWNITPQTFPVLIMNYDRTQLYYDLNDAGFGAVSLYHTMINPIQSSEYKDALWLSRHIINLPVHQDVKREQIEEMAGVLLDKVGS